MEKGDHIRVKDGTIDPDFKGKDLSGYTGYVEYIDGGTYVTILWDGPTLKRFDAKFIRKCDRKNLDHRKMALTIDEIEVIEPK
jgi:hypothetical protein